MTYILIMLTNGEWIKAASKDIVAVYVAETNAKDELIITRNIYSGTEDNTALSSEKELWHDIQERERDNASPDKFTSFLWDGNKYVEFKTAAELLTYLKDKE